MLYVIGFVVTFMFLRFGLCISIFEVLKSIPKHIKDIYHYVKEKKWKIFNKFGLEIFCGSFGKGKTLQAVNYVTNLHRRFPAVPIYANIHLSNIEYIPLTSFQDIVNIQGNAIVLVDEMGVMFNNRNYGDFPMALLDNILQCRHLGLLIIGTAQKYEDLDTIIRKNVTLIKEVKKLTPRLISFDTYNGYRVYYSKVDYHNIKPDARKVYMCVSDRMRNSYDTNEIATNITNVIDDTTYMNHKEKEAGKMVNKYKKKYKANKWSV